MRASRHQRRSPAWPRHGGEPERLPAAVPAPDLSADADVGWLQELDPATASQHPAASPGVELDSAKDRRAEKARRGRNVESRRGRF
jgi:hypothetical protein